MTNTNKLLITLAILMISVSAATTISVDQTGADSGKIIKGDLFTATASGWTGSCTSANIDFSDCPVCSLQNEDTVKSVSGSSVSWTSILASQTASNQKITVSLSGCSPPESGTSSSFQVILPPDLGATVSPTSFSEPAGSKQISLTVENTGENSLQDVYAIISLPSGVSTGESTSKNLGDVLGGSSVGTAWTVSFGSVSTSTITINIQSSNAGTVQKNIGIYVPAEEDESGGSSSGGSVVVSGTTEASTVTYGDTLEVLINTAGTYSFYPNQTFETVTVTANASVSFTAKEVTTVENTPGNLDAYKFVKFESDDEITSMTIKFSVTNDWLSQHQGDTGDVVILGSSGSGWETLTTKYVGSEGDMHYYEVSVSRLATTFSIGLLEGAEASETVVSACKEPGKWTECVEGKQTRNIEVLENGDCVQRSETIDCSALPTQWLTWIFKVVLAALLVVSLFFGYFIFKGKMKGKPIKMPPL